MAHTQLSVEEREEIQHGLWRKESVRSIARRLGRSHSSIVREINRNRPPHRRQYTSRLAEERALEKRRSRGRNDRLKNDQIRQYVVAHLKGGWSPEQVSALVSLEQIGSISHEAIYQYVYAQVHREGWGLLRPHCEDLRMYLRHKRKRRQKHGFRRSQRVLRPRGTSIDERPRVVDLRTRVGDWEGDTVESKDHRPGVNTLLERRTGLFLITKVKDKTAQATITAVESRMTAVPQELKHTLTLDNGPENSDWHTLEERTGLKTYFAHSYSSHERGANENANGLLREYFPKGTDFSTIPDDEIARVEYLLNTRPRKRLGWKTPLAVWGGALLG